MADHQHIAAMLAILRGDRCGYGGARVWRRRRAARHPADFAEVVPALAGPARWVNGQTIYVSGGLA
jgi:NAD(P)-dependent dehydrogenase (short-subunit alcohol dehydrogenase family)